MARKTNLTLLLSHEERQTLESWQRSTTIRAGLAKRGRIILLLFEGVPISEVSRRVGIRRRFIYKGAKRFQEKRLCAHCQLFFNMDDNYFLTLSQATFFILTA